MTSLAEADEWKFISIVSRSTILLGMEFYLPSGESFPIGTPHGGFNWKLSGRPPRGETLPRDLFLQTRDTRINIYIYTCSFLIHGKLIIYSRASCLCPWAIKSRRYSHNLLDRPDICRPAISTYTLCTCMHACIYVRVCLSRGQPVGHRSWITFLGHFSPIPFCTGSPFLRHRLALRSPRRSDCTGNRGR